MKNGGPAPESFTDALFEATKAVTAVLSCEAFPPIDLSTLGRTVVRGAAGEVVVEVIDTVEDHAKQLQVRACVCDSGTPLLTPSSTAAAAAAPAQTIFDFPAIRALVARPDFRLVYDGLSGGEGGG